MKSRQLVFLAGLLLLGIGGWWLLKASGGGSKQEATLTTLDSRDAGNPHVRSAVKSAELAKIDSRSMQNEISQLLAHAVIVMRGGNSEEIKQMLALLDKSLGSEQGDSQAAIAAIVDFLRSKQDAPTGQGFIVGKAGVLTEATTLRVYLMDQLGVLSRNSDGSQALAIARETLQGFGSADEWAISMRNVAWFDADSRKFLQQRVGAMLQHPAWRASPTIGMLESFDIIVHTGAMETVPELGRLISNPTSPLARASGVALDRLATTHALELTAFLNQQPELLSAIPLKRADLFAHADLGQQEQRKELENYLLRSDVDVRERRKFFASLVQSGRFVSHNLVTPYIPPETPAQAGVRLETLTRTVNEWMRDERFSTLSGELTTLGNTVNRILDEVAADSK